MLPELRRVIHCVETAEVGATTSYAEGRLVVGADDVKGLFEDPALAGVRTHTVSPGDSVRIVKPLDVVEPRSRGNQGGTFPGWLAPINRSRGGDLHILRGAAVLAAGFLPRNQEGLIDMSGPAAELSPFARTHNVVVEFDPAPDASWVDVEAAVRRGLLRLAVHLADAAAEAPADADEEPVAARPAAAAGGLPRLGVITNLQTQGAFKDVFVYGKTMADSLPTFVEPAEVDDGAVVSGQYGHPALRNPTYMHQNHPVLAALRARADVAFGGLVLCPEPVLQAGKELVSEHAAWLCRMAGFDAVIITKEGAGNADNDLAMKVDALEAAGVPAVALYAELSGPDGTGPPLVAGPRKGSVVSTGNYDQRFALQAVERALGGTRLDVAGADAMAAVEVPVATILSALSPLGAGRFTCATESSTGATREGAA